MRIHNDLHSISVVESGLMERLRNNINQFCPVLRSRYRKLFNDYACSKERLPSMMSAKSSCPHSASYNDHISHLKAEDLNCLLGTAFRAAYACRLDDCTSQSPLCNRNGSVRRKNNNVDSKTSWGRQTFARNLQQKQQLQHNDVAGRSCSVQHCKNVNILHDDRVGGGGSDRPYSPTLSSAPSAGQSSSELTVEEEKLALTKADWTRSADERLNSSLELSLCDSCSLSDSSSSCQHHQPAEQEHHQQEQERRQLRHAAWFQPGIPREVALEVLSERPVGSFMVRESSTRHGCFALSLRVPQHQQHHQQQHHSSSIAHYLIIRNEAGRFRIKGFTKEFSSLTALIVHHSVMPELLPVPLALNRAAEKGSHRSSEDLMQELSELASMVEDHSSNVSTEVSTEVSIDHTLSISSANSDRGDSVHLLCPQ